MKNFLILPLIILLFSFGVATGQSDDCTTTITLSSQEEVNNWGGCDKLEERLIISGADITDLSPLSSLIEVEKVLLINNNPELKNLAGLENLQAIGVSLFITDNEQLEDISALSKLKNIEVEIGISGNPALSSLDGLNNMVSCGAIYIENNDALVDLSPLDGLQSVGNYIQIFNNDGLTSINSFSQITEVPSQVILSANNGMTTLSAFQNVTSIQSELIISSNIALENIEGLENLRSVGVLVISNNDLLTNIDALSSLQSSGFIVVQGNPMLNECCGIYPVLSAATGSPVISILNNGATCSEAAAILENCELEGCPTDVTLSSQEEVDNWAACDTIEGQLIISGEDITDLSPLSSLTAVGTVLSINNTPQLTSLAGLENLESIGFSLFINDNESLEDISALSKLTTMQGQVGIRNNPALASLEGLQNLTYCSSIFITGNNALVDLAPLNGLQSIGDFIHVFTNNALTSIGGFNNITEVPSQVIISGNGVLQQLDAFENLTTIQNELVIVNNTSLESLSGLDSLNTVGDLILLNNAVLTDITALSNLQTINNSLELKDNVLLNECCAIYSVLNTTEIPSVSIENNDTDCSSLMEVLNTCNDEIQGVDIELSIHSNFTNYTIYKDIVYTIDITNNGTDTAGELKVRVPEAGAFDSMNNLAYTGSRILTPAYITAFDVVTGQINVSELPAGETASIEIVLFTLVDGQPIELFAQVYEQSDEDVDSAPNNNMSNVPVEDDEAVLTIYPTDETTEFADLELYLAANKTHANVGDEVVYNLSLTNKGPNAASGISISHPVFGDQTYVSHVLTAGDYEATAMLWTVGDLDAGNTVSLTLTLQVDAFDENTIKFQVQTVDQNDKDSAPGNAFGDLFAAYEDDEAVASILDAEGEEVLSPDLELSLTVDDTAYTLFDSITYLLTVTNTGNANASNVVINWPVPEGLAYQNAVISSEGHYHDWTGTWDIANEIAPGASESVELRLWTNVEGVPITSYAQVVQMSGADLDSFVGNGVCCTPNEDDEAAITIGESQKWNQGTSILSQETTVLIHRVYPNPATDEITFYLTSTTDEAIDYAVYNLQGAMLQQAKLDAGKGAKTLQLDISSYPTGMYYIKFNTVAFRQPVRFVKQ